MDACVVCRTNNIHLLLDEYLNHAISCHINFIANNNPTSEKKFDVFFAAGQISIFPDTLARLIAKTHFNFSAKKC